MTAVAAVAAVCLAVIAASTYRCRKCDRTGNMFWGAFHLHRRKP